MHDERISHLAAVTNLDYPEVTPEKNSRFFAVCPEFHAYSMWERKKDTARRHRFPFPCSTTEILTMSCVSARRQKAARGQV